MTPHDYSLLLCCIGWNSRTWAGPISKIFIKTDILNRKNMRVLELGAGRVSALGAIFFRNTNHVKISYYDQSTFSPVASRIDALTLKIGCAVYKRQFVQASILDLHGTYDVIIMKSVLGGVFRTHRSNQNINDFLEAIVANNLTDNGILITVDNGVPFYGRLIEKFGARGAHWRCFRPDEFSGASFQYCFGLLGAFSLKMRLGPLGEVFENLIHFTDCALFSFFNKSPTVIASAYVKIPPVPEQENSE
jgi:hypothetical protein